MPSNQFNRQYAFLTYSQTTKKFTPQVLLKKISQKAGVEQYLISQERHKDGGYHLHAYFKFQKKLDVQYSFFDIEYWGKKRHPNIQVVGAHKHKLWRYIKKDKFFITNIDETRPKWLQLLEDTATDEEFLIELMWTLNRMDNYAGYNTLMKLRQAIRQRQLEDNHNMSVKEYLAKKR